MKLLLQMTATAVLRIWKRMDTMAAELDRLNAAVAANDAAVAAVVAKINELLDVIRTVPAPGVDPVAVDAAAAQIEAAAQALVNASASQV